jgi:hypothetical protein
MAYRLAATGLDDCRGGNFGELVLAWIIGKLRLKLRIENLDFLGFLGVTLYLLG